MARARPRALQQLVGDKSCSSQQTGNARRYCIYPLQGPPPRRRLLSALFFRFPVDQHPTGGPAVPTEEDGWTTVLLLLPCALVTPRKRRREPGNGPRRMRTHDFRWLDDDDDATRSISAAPAATDRPTDDPSSDTVGPTNDAQMEDRAAPQHAPRPARRLIPNGAIGTRTVGVMK